MRESISIERAAEIAKLSIHELISNLSKLGVPSNLTKEELEKII
jgi:predicted HTH domain antitoxin